MDLNIAGGAPLKQFTRALACLARIGDELDFSAAHQRLSISTVNSSRTAFGIAHFYSRFFADFRLADLAADGPCKFSITAKPFLSALRTKSTVESVSIAVHESEEGVRSRHREPGVDSGECRLVIHLFCEHGVRKKHSLTYSDPNVQNWARFDLDACTSSWTVSSRVLKDWTDHFHIRPGSSGAADEITFYCDEAACRLKSFNDSGFDGADTVATSGPDAYSLRPLETELAVDVGDFDAYDVPEAQVVTFALKEFKSIITLSDSLPAALTAHFSTGGRPLMLQLHGDYFEAKFVVATTDYDSGGSSSRAGSAAAAPAGASVKREKSESVPLRAAAAAAPPPRGNASGSGSSRGAQRPLFNAPTPSPAPPPAATSHAAVDDAFGDGVDDDGDALFDDMDAAFVQIDRLSQAHLAMSQQAARVLVSDTTQGFDDDEHYEGEREAMRGGARTQMGPTQAPSGGASVGTGPCQGGSGRGGGSAAGMRAEELREREREAKRARWNLMGDY
ncbi:hypothetical protein JCM3770_004978 [Rhodotorula araucariae]